MFSAGRLLAQEGGDGLFLGEDFFPWMVLAFGAAMVVGNVLALLRPPDDVRKGGANAAGADSDGAGAGGSNSDGENAGISSGAMVPRDARPPVGRSVALILAGLAASAWGLASLLS